MSETTRTGREARTDRDASRRQKTPVYASNWEDHSPDNGEVAQDSLSTAQNGRLMTDGGQNLLDPLHLPRTWSPALVHHENGVDFVANRSILSSGWLAVKHWDRTKIYYPPQQIEKVERVDTERTDRPGNQAAATHGVADDDLLEDARRLAQPTETEGDTPTAVADGGER